MKPVFKDILNYLENERPVPGLSIAIKGKTRDDRLCWGSFSGNDSTRVDENTIYDLASITKLYTTLAILLLVEAKELKLEDNCSIFIDTFSNSNLKLIDLLTQRANFNLRLAPLREKYGETLKTEIYKVRPPIYADTEVHYENITFIYLGKILERVHRKPLEEIFGALFKSFGLEDTYVGLLDQNQFVSPPTEIQNDRIIQDYTHDETSRLLGGIAGNAGVFSSTNDLLKFAEIWLQNDFIKKITFTNYNQHGNLPQGLGWWNRIQNSKNRTPDIFSHPGFTGGIIMIHIPSETVCAMLTNRTFYGRDNRKHELIWQLLAEEIGRE